MLLGMYDNVFLCHADRDRITSAASKAWMGVNGGVGSAFLLDGLFGGIWRAEEGRVQLDVFGRRPSRSRRRSTPRSPGSRSCSSTPSAPAGGPRRAAPRPRPRRPSRCAAPAPPSVRRARRGEGRELLVGDPALGTDHDHDRRRRPSRRQRRRAARSATSCSTTARSAARAAPATSAVVASSVDLGQPRAARLLAGLARRGPPPRQRLRRPLAAPDATQRAAAHGTIRSTPISVSTSTASSARSPLGIACTTVTDGAAARQ